MGGGSHVSCAVPRDILSSTFVSAPEPVWTFYRTEKSLAPTGIRSRDCPARRPVTTPPELSQLQLSDGRELYVTWFRMRKCCRAIDCEAWEAEFVIYYKGVTCWGSLAIIGEDKNNEEHQASFAVDTSWVRLWSFAATPARIIGSLHQAVSLCGQAGRTSEKKQLIFEYTQPTKYASGTISWSLCPSKHAPKYILSWCILELRIRTLRIFKDFILSLSSKEEMKIGTGFL